MYVFNMVIVLLFLGAFANEPLCSKFSYDEALLEKMIRTEVKFEQLQREFKGLREELKMSYDKMSEELQDMATQMNQMLDTVKGTVNDVQKGRLEMTEEFNELNVTSQRMTRELLQETNEMLAHKEKQIERISEDLRAVYTNLRDNLTETVSTPMIAFKATDSRTRTLSSGAILDFSYILYNKGNGYDPTNGKFTAPVKGLYVFTVQMCTHINNFFSGQIVVDENEVGRFSAGDRQWETCNTGDTIVTLDIGQNVYVKVIHGARVYSDKYRLSSFSGALLNT